MSPRFIVGVAGIVLNEQGEVLLAHHVFRGDNAWGPPGGIINYGEGLPEAAYREILKETGLQVEVGPLLQVGIGERWPHVTFHSLCTVEGAAQPQVNGERIEAGFYPPNALPSTLTLFRQPGKPAGVRIVGTKVP